MTCTADNIVSKPMSLIEQCTLRYFEQFVGNLSTKDLSTLLQFITGLPVCTDKGVMIILMHLVDCYVIELLIPVSANLSYLLCTHHLWIFHLKCQFLTCILGPCMPFKTNY